MYFIGIRFECGKRKKRARPRIGIFPGKQIDMDGMDRSVETECQRGVPVDRTGCHDIPVFEFAELRVPGCAFYFAVQDMKCVPHVLSGYPAASGKIDGTGDPVWMG